MELEGDLVTVSFDLSSYFEYKDDGVGGMSYTTSLISYRVRPESRKKGDVGPERQFN